MTNIEATRKSSRRVRPPAALALLTTLTLALTSCAGGGSEASGSQDDSFVMAVTTVPDTVDPVLSTSTAPMNYLDFALESLTKINPDGKAEPSLATDWEFSDDGLVLTMKLREGVKFHDGNPLDAEAVKFNFDRYLDPELKIPNRQILSALEAVKVVDKQTIELHLSRTDPTFITALSSTQYGIISPASIDKNSNNYENVVHPVGTGPYSFVDYVTNQEMNFIKFEDYWGDKPYYADVKLRILPEPSTREAELLAGRADAIMAPPMSDLEALSNNPAVNVVMGDTNRMIYMAMNTQEEPFSDVKVRQALNYAVNKEELMSSVLFDAGSIMTAPVASTMEGHCEQPPYTYDPARARKLLQEAGAENITVELIAPNGHYAQDTQVAQAVAGYLQDVGVNVTTQTTDWATYLTWVAEPSEEQGPRINMFGWAGFVSDAGQLTGVWTTDSAPPNSFNTSFYSNDEVDNLMKNAASEMDDEVRNDMYCEAQKHVWEDAPWIFLWNQKMPIVTQANITGIEILPTEKFRAVDVRPID